MICVFGYGSNMAPRGLKAKNVTSYRSRPARLPGYRFGFDVPSVFSKVEGGVANISEAADAEVHGVVHETDAQGLAFLDGIEAIGILYERRTVELIAYDGERLNAETYVGVPSIRDAALRPSTRYIALLVEGATEAGLDPKWIDMLRTTPPHAPPRKGPFEPRGDVGTAFDAAKLATHPSFVALHGLVFDLSEPLPPHRTITMLRGGKDLTPIAVALGAGVDAAVPEAERKLAALHELQHELAASYPIVGRYES